jgi:6-phosphogluconolactonase
MKIFNLLSLMLIPVVFSISGCRKQTRVVVGCFSETGDSGLIVYDFNLSDGNLKLLSGSNAGPNPSYFCISKTRKLIYAANEVSEFNGVKGGGLTTLKYTGNFENIEKVNEIPVPNGGPCFISVTPGNDFLLISNYAGGSVAVVKLDEKGIPERVSDTIIYNIIGENHSHAHMISADPAGKRIYVTDLGLNRIMIYTLDKLTGKLNPFSESGTSLPEGTGPRHFVFNESGSVLYVIGELGSTVSVFNVDEKEGLKLFQTISTRGKDSAVINYCADIHISKSGLFLYGSNRGENSIVTFRIERDGKLSLAGHTDCGGNWPRNFVLDPSEKYILVGNQKSGDISVFSIDEKSGIPSPVGQKTNLTGPACLKF